MLSPGRLSRRPVWDPENMTPREMLEQALEPPLRGTVAKVVGLHFSWFVYRGDEEGKF